MELIGWLVAFWIAVLGSVVGSFLNVVVYRLPAGLNIAWPGSFCPLCRHAVRWFDNIPVLSWLLLRGRCRDCRGPISIRYPLVESGTAAMFALLAALEIFAGGINLPVRAVSGQPSAVSGQRSVQFGAGLPKFGAGLPTPPPPDRRSAGLGRPSVGGVARSETGHNAGLAELIALWAFHAALLSTLLAAALIACDGKRPPWKLFLPMLLVGLAAPACWPQLHPVPAWPALVALPLAGLLDGVAGLAAGVLLGWLASGRRDGRRATDDGCSIFGQGTTAADSSGATAGLSSSAEHTVGQANRGTRQSRPAGAIAAAACVGVTLGWQAACALTLTAAAIYQLPRLVGRRGGGPARLPGAAWLALATLGWIALWAQLVRWASLW